MGQLPAKNFKITLIRAKIILMKMRKDILSRGLGSKMCLEENRPMENQLDGGKLELHLDPDPD